MINTRRVQENEEEGLSETQKPEKAGDEEGKDYEKDNPHFVLGCMGYAPM